MSLAAGSVTVNPDASYTGTALAKALMDAKVSAFDPRNMHGVDSATKASVMQSLANEAIAMASAVTSWLAAGGYT